MSAQAFCGLGGGLTTDETSTISTNLMHSIYIRTYIDVTCSSVIADTMVQLRAVYGRVCAAHGKSTPFAQRSTADCAALFLLAPLCAREPAERALWPRARFRSSHVSMLRLTFELSGPQMRRTPMVAVATKAASAAMKSFRISDKIFLFYLKLSVKW